MILCTLNRFSWYRKKEKDQNFFSLVNLLTKLRTQEGQLQYTKQNSTFFVVVAVFSFDFNLNSLLCAVHCLDAYPISTYPISIYARLSFIPR